MLLILIGAALLTAGSALQCEVCFAINTNTCSDQHYETCKSTQNHCMTKLTETSMGHGDDTLSSATLQKSCGSSYDCTHPATLTTTEFQVRVTTKCCNQDFCNNGTIAGHPQNSTMNGVTCESCFARDSEKCGMKRPMNCSGDEMHCVQYSATRDGSTITVAGCASESMQMSEGTAAFKGSSVVVHQMRNSSKSWSWNTFLLPWFAVMATLWTCAY
ncbi:phospholipase A2 inhibitor and Ly6/PLAUR domain-containing protein-like [Hyperolius riggenbachi]|uniref:phospholipase A2 inhibitor and Ly6/PLAUR domain-containing protein-like n=1 Tax=Hyperolius riggenbachi TaxID=752182 RepID=UPI0035A2C4FD